MINDIRFMRDQEMSLDEWVDETLAPIGDTIYFIVSTITRLMDSFNIDKGIE